MHLKLAFKTEFRVINVPLIESTSHFKNLILLTKLLSKFRVT